MSVSRQSVHELIARNVIDRGDDGLIDVAMARLALANRVRPSAKSASFAAATPAAAPAISPASNDQAITSYHVAKTLREAAEATIAELKLAEMRGHLVSVDEVRASLQRRIAGVREALLQLPARVVPLLVANPDAASMDRLLREEITAAMQQISDT